LSDFVAAAGERNGWDEDLVFQLTLALEEVVVNAIKHGQREQGRHDIEVTVRAEEDWVVMTVEDDGIAFNPLDAPPADIGAALENRPIGGLGVHLVRSLIPDLSYTREGDRNRLVMRKQIAVRA
jgi:anti-sigma regulatory factor (Ser/Thr protein kinase)